jgi:excinuclease ABC subunit C
MEKFKFLPKEKLEKIPKEAGVYCFSNKDEILYIGKAGNLRERIKNHFQNPSFKDHLFLDKVKKIGYLKTSSEIEALILEAKLIKKYQPKFNVIWRDSKNYFFVAITKEDFPKVFWTHQKKLKTQKLKTQKLNIVGPFVDGKALKKNALPFKKNFSLLFSQNPS